MKRNLTLMDRAPLAQGVLSPSVSELVSVPVTGRVQSSPYFQVNRPQRRVGTDGFRHLNLVIMAKAVINYIAGSGNTALEVDYYLYDNSHAFVGGYAVNVNVDTSSNSADIVSAYKSAVISDASGHGQTLTLSDVLTPFAPIPASLSGAPQAAIADAPADAVTNYNVVTTLLGALTGAVNTANGKQNDIATKLNSLLAELRTLGLIAP